jgi:hypothetical protein
MEALFQLLTNSSKPISAISFWPPYPYQLFAAVALLKGISHVLILACH